MNKIYLSQLPPTPSAPPPNIKHEPFLMRPLVFLFNNPLGLSVAPLCTDVGLSTGACTINSGHIPKENDTLWWFE